MVYIPVTLREEVVQRAKARCEYCQTQELIIIYMQVDHIEPLSSGGETVSDNLCLTCGGCNRSKTDFTTGFDPQTGDELRLYNPRTHQWSEHFRWNEDFTQILGITPVGRATIDRLKMNRPKVVNSRRVWRKAGWHPPKS